MLQFWGFIAILVAGVLVSCLRGGAGGSIVADLVVFLVSLVDWYGVWLVTTPDPSGAGEDQYGSFRQTCRVALVLDVIGTVINVLTAPMAHSAGFAEIVAILNTAFGIAGGVMTVAHLGYLSRLARRLPDDAMERQAWMLMKANAVCSGGMVLLGVAFYFVPPFAGTPKGAGQWVIIAFGLMIGLASLVFNIMALILIWRMGKKMRYKARWAQQNWNLKSSPNP